MTDETRVKLDKNDGKRKETAHDQGSNTLSVKHCGHSIKDIKWLMPQSILQEQPKSCSRKRNEIFFDGQVSHLITTQHAFQLLNTKLKVQKPTTNQQKSGCNEGLTEHLKGGQNFYPSTENNPYI